MIFINNNIGYIGAKYFGLVLSKLNILNYYENVILFNLINNIFELDFNLNIIQFNYNFTFNFSS